MLPTDIAQILLTQLANDPTQTRVLQMRASAVLTKGKASPTVAFANTVADPLAPLARKTVV
jgi:hypothetical protein